MFNKFDMEKSDIEIIRRLRVDDEKDFRTTLAGRLKRRNMDVIDGGNGKEAIELVREKSFDVAVVEIKMPGMDGIETLRQIKKIVLLVEVILLTGHASAEGGHWGMKSGAYDYVIKPCNVNALLFKVEGRGCLPAETG